MLFRVLLFVTIFITTSCASHFSKTGHKVKVNNLTGERSQILIIDIRQDSLVGKSLYLKMTRNSTSITNAELITAAAYGLKHKGTLIIKADNKVYKFDLKDGTLPEPYGLAFQGYINPKELTTWKEIAKAKKILIQVNSDEKSHLFEASQDEINALKKFAGIK